MALIVQKRDGREVDFDEQKITDAIFKAAQAVGGANKALAMELTVLVLRTLQSNIDKTHYTVEEIQDTVEKVLIEQGHAKTAKAYILYRDQRNRIRASDADLRDYFSMTHLTAEERLWQIAKSSSISYSIRHDLSNPLADSVKRGEIFLPGMWGYDSLYGQVALQWPIDSIKKGYFYKLLNRLYGQLRQMLRECYGSIVWPAFDSWLAAQAEHIPEEELYFAFEDFLYLLNHTPLGLRKPQQALTITFGLDTSIGGRKIIKSFLLAYEQFCSLEQIKSGPALVFDVQPSINMAPGCINYDLFRLAVRVAAQNGNPQFSFMHHEQTMTDYRIVYSGFGSRLLWQPSGGASIRLAEGVLNLPHLAMQVKGDVLQFYHYLSTQLDMLCEGLKSRYDQLIQAKVEQLPALQQVASSCGYELRDWLKTGHLSVGFLGLAETLIALTGHHHGQNNDSRVLGEDILSFMREKTEEASKQLSVPILLAGWLHYGLCQQWSQFDQVHFGLIKGVTDGAAYQPAFSIPAGVLSEIDRLRLEGAYHKYCPGGHASLVHYDYAPMNDLSAVEEILKTMATMPMGLGGLRFPHT